MSSEWEKFRREQERLRREAEARARELEQHRQFSEHGRLREEAKKQESREELQRRKIEKEQESVRQLLREARDVYNIYEIAESLRSSWESEGASVQVTPVQEPHVELNDDGTVKRNRSSVGVRVSYSYRDVGTDTVPARAQGGDPEAEVGYTTSYYAKTETTKVSFGIGYFDRPYERISRIEMPLSDEAIQKGVKSYYVSGIAIPVAHADSKNLFFRELDGYLLYENPGKKLPAAARRLREHGLSETPARPQTPPTPQQPGFFRRLFKKG